MGNFQIGHYSPSTPSKPNLYFSLFFSKYYQDGARELVDNFCMGIDFGNGLKNFGMLWNP